MDTAAADVAARRARSARFATMPIVLAGTIAVTAGLTGPVAHAEPRHDDGGNRRHVDQDRQAAPDRNVGSRPVFGTAVARPGQAVVATVAATHAVTPGTYTVAQGDTVSAIAARYGLSPQEVLVRNGLSWNTIIHPGQTLRLTTTPVAAPASAAPSTGGTSYHVKQGDTVSGIAARSGVSTAALLGANRLTSSSTIYPGQSLSVPSASDAAAPTASAAAPATRAAGADVTIHSGDTIGAIAARVGVTLPALLAANGLTYTSTIYAGGTLVMPASGTSAGASPSVTASGLTAEQRANAATIVSVGRSLGVPQRGLVIALAAAMQESSLRNLSHGDRDSVGLFQQRPSQGWGTAEQLSDPGYATRTFFTGVSGTTAGLLDIPGWSSMDVTSAAQAVQISAFPQAYGKWERPAQAWLASL